MSSISTSSEIQSGSSLHIQRAIVAGVAAALAMSAIGAIWSQIGLARTDLLSILGVQVIAVSFHRDPNAVGVLGMLLSVFVGGLLVGIPFAWFRQRQHANVLRTGALIGIGMWLAAQVVVIPLLGFAHEPPPGLFSMNAGPAAAIGSLLAHLVAGLLLGEIYEPYHAPLDD